MMNRDNNHIVIAVDGSENACRAVEYVGGMLGGWQKVRVTLLHILHAPEEDYFSCSAERERWIQSGRKKAMGWLDDYRRMLLGHGMDSARVSVVIAERDGPSLSRLILNETGAMGAGTIVVGRQGLTRKEEFLFGSVSKQIVSHARKCTVWVVH